jgi:hypothetical protein
MQNIILGKVNKLIIHSVGNKNNGDGVRFSNRFSEFVNSEKDILYLINNSFKSNELFQFYFIPELALNPVYQFVSAIFQEKETFIGQSKNCARFLYDSSTHPKIKAGEFYVVYFKDCIIDGETVDTVGLFKSENKDTFLKVFPNRADDGFEIESEKGININKLDKGCLIFNTDKENGYIVAVVDNTNKSTQYWIDDFLHVRQRQDEYYNTQNILLLYKNFVDEMPTDVERARIKQAEVRQRSKNFFKENDTFDIEDFTNEVISEPEMIESFNRYKKEYQREAGLEISDSFTISDTAVKKQARTFKSVIKLDENVDIHIHGDTNVVEQGTDEKGKFYKIYYEAEE